MKTKSNAKQTKLPSEELIRKLRQTPRPIVAWSVDYPSGHCVAMHKHERDQLLYASVGVMTVSTETGLWVVPPLRAVWIPAFTEHQTYCSSKVLMRTLYIEPGKFAAPLKECAVVTISPLLRELILHATAMPRLYDVDGPDGRIGQVILDCIQMLEVTPLKLPIPSEDKLVIIQEALLGNPADQRTLSEWANLVGLTCKTLARRVQAELGLTFGQWRQQIRLLESLKRLGNKEAVTNVAIDLGYDSPSAFITMFKKALGCTPGQYFRDPS